MLTEQQKKAVEEAVSSTIKPGTINSYLFTCGIYEVINNPSKYGLQPINEWNKDTPPFDGLFLCFVVKKNECGTFSKYQKVVECSKNKWVVLDNERVARWMYLPNEPQREIGFADMLNHVEVGFRNNIYKPILNRGRTKGNE